MTSVPDMYHRHPTSGFRNFFKLRYAEDLCPQTATRVHSSPSSHLSQDECNPTGSLFIHTPKKKKKSKKRSAIADAVLAHGQRRNRDAERRFIRGDVLNQRVS